MKNPGLGTEPAIDGDNPALETVRIDVAAARDAALPEERVIASHADENDTEYLMAETDCYLSSAIGHSWPVGVDPEDVRTVVWESQRWVLGFDG